MNYYYYNKIKKLNTMEELTTMIEQLREEMIQSIHALQVTIEELNNNLAALDAREASNEAATGDWVTTITNQYDTQFADIVARLEAANL